MIDPVYLLNFKKVTNEDLIVAGLVLDEIKCREINNILDVGAGTGIVSAAIRQNLMGEQSMTAVDEIGLYSSYYENDVTFMETRFQDFESQENFDLVLLSHVLGDFDVSEREDIISKAIAFLSLSGVLVSVENGPNELFDKFTREIFDRHGTQFVIDPETLISCALKAGLKVKKSNKLTVLRIGESVEEAVVNTNVLFPRIFDSTDVALLRDTLHAFKCGPIYTLPVCQTVIVAARDLT